MRISLLLLLAWALLLAACETTTVEPEFHGALQVTVLDARTSQPLANAAISTNPATGSYATDAQGKVTVDQVPVGTISVIARRPNYEQLTNNVYITRDQTQSVVILLVRTASTAAPSPPARPDPANGATSQPADVTLAWRPVGAAKADSLRYDVALFEGSSLTPQALLTNSRDTTARATGLLFGTTYRWQVTVRNPAGAVAQGPVWSFQTRPLPDNRYLYARTVAGNTDIYSSDNLGNNLVRLTNATTVETAPQLSPNRDLVAYTSNASGQFQLYTMNRDGSNQRRITTLAVEGYNNAGVGYRWSPDGAQLIYAHYDQLYRVNRDGTGLMLLATAPTGRHFRECDWTVQNGSRLAVQTVGVNIYDSEIYLYNVDGTSPVLFVSNLPGRVDSPIFSVDGRSLLYTHDITGFNSATGRQLDAHLFIQRLDNSSTVDVTAGAGGSTTSGKIVGSNDLEPRFSPDGFRLIFVNQMNDGLSAPDIWTSDLDGRNRARLLSNAFLPDWK